MATQFLLKTGIKRKGKSLVEERYELIQKVKCKEENSEIQEARQKSLKNPPVEIHNSTMINGDSNFLYKKLIHKLSKISVTPSADKTAANFQSYYTDEEEQCVMGPALQIDMDQFLHSGVRAFNVMFVLRQSGFKSSDDMENYLHDLVNPTDYLIANQLRLVVETCLDLHQDVVLFKDHLTSLQDLLQSYNTLVAALTGISWKTLQVQLEKMALERVHLENQFRIEDIELLTHIVFILRCHDLLQEAYIQLLAAEDILCCSIYVVRFTRIFHEFMFNNMYTFGDNCFKKPEVIGNYRTYNIYRSLLHGHGYQTKFLPRRVLYLANNVCGDYFKEYFESYSPIQLEKELHTYVSVPDHSYQMCKDHIHNLCLLIHATNRDDLPLPMQVEQQKTKNLVTVCIQPRVDELESSKISHGTMHDEDSAQLFK